MNVSSGSITLRCNESNLGCAVNQAPVRESLRLSGLVLVLPYFVMMPGMGMGIAASRTPKPNVARLKSVAAHSMFGIGMYLTAQLMESAA